MEIDAYENVSFDGMKIVTMLFDERPSFDKIFARACEEISCNINDSRISI
jgi:glycine cleavage system regulatory protein